MRNLVLILAIAALWVPLAGCASDVSKSETNQQIAALNDKGWAALQRGDFGGAIALAMPKAEQGDAEFEFTVGYLKLEWLENPDAIEPPEHTAQDGLLWVRKAAAKGVPQAAGLLSSGYKWGWYGLPKDEALHTCWRNVEIYSQDPDSCVVAETKKSRH